MARIPTPELTLCVEVPGDQPGEVGVLPVSVKHAQELAEGYKEDPFFLSEREKERYINRKVREDELAVSAIMHGNDRAYAIESPPYVVERVPQIRYAVVVNPR